MHQINHKAMSPAKRQRCEITKIENLLAKLANEHHQKCTEPQHENMRQ